MMQKKILSIFLLLLEIHMNYGQMFSFGTCKAVTPMPLFNIANYAGTWYLQKEFKTILNPLFKCQKLVYTHTTTSPNVLKWQFTQKSSVPFVDKATGTLTQTTPAVFKTEFDGVLSLLNWEQTVIGTDYLNFAVVYGCKKFGPILMEHVYVLTRMQVILLDPATLSAVDNFLQVLNILPAGLVASTQTAC